MVFFSKEVVLNKDDFNLINQKEALNSRISSYSLHGIPVECFSRDLCILESVVVQMRNFNRFSFPLIAKILNRAVSTITTTYARAEKKKLESNAHSSFSGIPFCVFAYRELSVFESLVMYLKYIKGLDYKNITLLIERSHDVVWRVHKNATSKISPKDYINNIGKSALEEMEFFSKHRPKFKSKANGKSNHAKVEKNNLYENENIKNEVGSRQ